MSEDRDGKKRYQKLFAHYRRFLKNLLRNYYILDILGRKDFYKHNYLYNHNEISKREIKETIPIIITSKRIKYLVVNLTKEVSDIIRKL